MHTRKAHATREAPSRGQAQDQPDAREGQAWRDGVAEGLVVPGKPGNAGGGKGPWFKADAGNDEDVRFDEGGVEPELRRGYSGTARRKGRPQTNRTYCHRATSLLYRQ